MAKEKKEVKDIKFTKEELLKATIFNNRKDVLCVVVKDNETVSVKEATERIKNFMEGKVK